MKIDIYDQHGKKTGEHTLNPEIFAVEINEGLIHLALTRQLSNIRNPIAKTKNRSERRGGGRKPFKQKGTGNARAGSRRSPIWRKGGVIFGPTGLENFNKNMPKSQRRKALFCTLSAKAAAGEIIALAGYEGEIKTKAFAEMIAKLPVERNALLVIAEKNTTIQKSAQNLANVKVILANYLNIADLLKYQSLIFLPESLTKIDDVWKSKKLETSSPVSKPKTSKKTQDGAK